MAEEVLLPCNRNVPDEVVPIVIEAHAAFAVM